MRLPADCRPQLDGLKRTLMATEPLDPSTDPVHARARAVQQHYAPAEARALGTLAIFATLAILWVMVPVGLGVLLGTLLAFTAYPRYQSLTRRTHRPALIATLVTLGTALTVAGTLAVLAYLLILKGMALFAVMPQSMAPGGAGDKIVQRLEPLLHVAGLEPAALADKLRGAIGEIAASLAGWATRIAGAVFEGALALFFMSTTMYFVLRRWGELGSRAENLMPLNPRHTRRLLREMRRLGRVVVIGNFGTAVLQGVIAGLGFAIARVPEAAFLGAITAVTSLVPVVGTMLVWVPTALLLLAGGHPVAGAFTLTWGAFAVVGFCDYAVRPVLVGGGESMSSWMMFVALFGGIELFGFVGVLLGPMIVGIALAALRLYERTRRFRLGLH
jgi:predicted PurR-regulated permease PerM